MHLGWFEMDIEYMYCGEELKRPGIVLMNQYPMGTFALTQLRFLTAYLEELSETAC